MQPRVVIQTEDFNVTEVLTAMRASDLRVGAICTFVGTVRDTRMLTGQAVDEVVSMTLEHYPGMTESAIEAMIEEAHQRFDFYQAKVIHRVGELKPADQIVLVAVTLMDYLKTQAPFWKKEQTPDGAKWVDARVSDDKALARWGIKSSNA
jgi:molybdopterin synthase catalytic subunit